jgi:hypothetical protein
MHKDDKERLVTELTERLKSSQTLIVADYRGLTNAEIDALRGKLLEEGARFSVVKNTLTRRAAEASSARRPLPGSFASWLRTARSAPCVRRWRVRARVSISVIAGTFQRFRYSSSEPSLEWWLGTGQAHRTMSARAHGLDDSVSASRTP